MSTFEKGLLTTSFILFLLALLIVATGCDSSETWGPPLTKTYQSEPVKSESGPAYFFKLDEIVRRGASASGTLYWSNGKRDSTSTWGTAYRPGSSFWFTAGGFQFDCVTKSDSEMRCDIEGRGFAKEDVYFEGRN